MGKLRIFNLKQSGYVCKIVLNTSFFSLEYTAKLLEQNLINKHGSNHASSKQRCCTNLFVHY